MDTCDGCMHACVCLPMYMSVGTHVPWHTSGNQSTTSGVSPYFPPCLLLASVTKLAGCQTPRVCLDLTIEAPRLHGQLYLSALCPLSHLPSPFLPYYSLLSGHQSLQKGNVWIKRHQSQRHPACHKHQVLLLLPSCRTGRELSSHGAETGLKSSGCDTGQ